MYKLNIDHLRTSSKNHDAAGRLLSNRTVHPITLTRCVNVMLGNKRYDRLSISLGICKSLRNVKPKLEIGVTSPAKKQTQHNVINYIRRYIILCYLMVAGITGSNNIILTSSNNVIEVGLRSGARAASTSSSGPSSSSSPVAVLGILVAVAAARDTRSRAAARAEKRAETLIDGIFERVSVIAALKAHATCTERASREARYNKQYHAKQRHPTTLISFAKERAVFTLYRETNS